VARKSPFDTALQDTALRDDVARKSPFDTALQIVVVHNLDKSDTEATGKPSLCIPCYISHMSSGRKLKEGDYHAPIAPSNFSPHQEQSVVVLQFLVRQTKPQLRLENWQVRLESQL